jgi:TRAP-type mannitol/chloroaromatic compound transport system permease small subunit
MRPLLAFAGAVDRLNDLLFTTIKWLTLVMIVVGAYNAIARYVTRWSGVALASNAYFDLQWYMFSLIFLLGAAYGLNRNVHVRVDVLYERFTERTRAWIDLVGVVLFVVPFSAMMLITSWPAVRNSWAVREASSDPGGLARYPIKTVILVCFSLLLLQAIAIIIRRSAMLRGTIPFDAVLADDGAAVPPHLPMIAPDAEPDAGPPPGPGPELAPGHDRPEPR